MDSEVRFTIGNHDAGTVTAFPLGSLDGSYVEESHLFFPPSGCTVSRAKEKQHTHRRDHDLYARRDMLLPFYACSPYIMLTFGGVAFVHAGFVQKGAKGVYEDARTRQKQLDQAPLENDTDLVDFFAPTRSDATAKGDTPYVLWW
jgi:hypothetical protein